MVKFKKYICLLTLAGVRDRDSSKYKKFIKKLFPPIFRQPLSHCVDFVEHITGIKQHFCVLEISKQSSPID